MPNSYDPVERAMSYRMDYEEPISDVVTRLVQEHEEIDRKLKRISEISSNRDRNLRVAISLLNSVSTEILRHAIEEEARLARVIMESDETRKSSDESVKILQEHRRIREFFDDELPYVMDENSEKQTRKMITEFVEFLIKHHKEEEEELFPLSLRAASSSR